MFSRILQKASSAIQGSNPGQLAPGVRAAANTVGYLESPANLTILNNGDTLPGGWNGEWDTGALVVRANSVTIDHYRINAEVVLYGSNPTVTNCQIYPGVNALFGVTLAGFNKGVLTVMDTTIVGNSTGANPQVNGISSDSGLVAIRCDVSATGDGIHMVAQANPAQAVISQCYIHDQAFIDEAQHCDGIQIYNEGQAGSPNGFFTVEHTSVMRSTSTLSTPMNAALTCGPPTTNSEALVAPTFDNNYFQAGLYHLRMNFRLHDSVVTNNDFGPIYPSEYGIINVEEPSAVATWSNNRDSNGTLIAQP